MPPPFKKAEHATDTDRIIYTIYLIVMHMGSVWQIRFVVYTDGYQNNINVSAWVAI